MYYASTCLERSKVVQDSVPNEELVLKIKSCALRAKQTGFQRRGTGALKNTDSGCSPDQAKAFLVPTGLLIQPCKGQAGRGLLQHTLSVQGCPSMFGCVWPPKVIGANR